MSTPVTISTIGRVTADLELKTSQNGKNTKYIQFGFAVNKGYGDDTHANFYSCVLYGEAAQRMMDAKVKKGSLIQIVGDLELVEFARRDGSPGWTAKITLYNWNYAPTNRPKNESGDGDPSASDGSYPPAEDCGSNGLPYGFR